MESQKFQNSSKQKASPHYVEVSPFIEGRRCDSDSDQSLERFNPATGETLPAIPEGCKQDVNKAVTSSRRAFIDGRWAQQQPSQRQEILRKLAALIDDHASEMDYLDAIDMGKPVSLTRANAGAAATQLRYYADSASNVFGDVFNSGSASMVTQQKVPRGIIAAITPWNFPTYNAISKLAPALAAGNCVVLKPSEFSSQSSMLLVQLAIQAGLPSGVLNMVPGSGKTVGRALAIHPDIDMVTFTGSTTVGKHILRYSGESNMKVVHAECGGKSPQIVFSDCEDLNVTADHVAQIILVNQGQLCVAGSRLLVQEDIKAQILEKVAERFQQIRPGNPLDSETNYGPLVNRQQLDKVESYIRNGEQEGCLFFGGQRILKSSGGYFIEPTIFTDVEATARILQDEIFGPVLTVSSFRTVEEAVEMANSTTYGLAAYAWTTNLNTGLQISKGVKAGMVIINASAPKGEGAMAMSVEPYGLSGVGVESGFGGLEAYLRKQVTWFNH